MIFKPSCNHFCLVSLLSWRSGHHKTRIPSLSRSYLIYKHRYCVLEWVLILFVTKERDANSKQAVFNLKKRETHSRWIAGYQQLLGLIKVWREALSRAASFCATFSPGPFSLHGNCSHGNVILGRGGTSQFLYGHPVHVCLHSYFFSPPPPPPEEEDPDDPEEPEEPEVPEEKEMEAPLPAYLGEYSFTQCTLSTLLGSVYLMCTFFSVLQISFSFLPNFRRRNGRSQRSRRSQRRSGRRSLLRTCWTRRHTRSCETSGPCLANSSHHTSCTEPSHPRS